MNTETWKPVEGFKNYEVSNLGRVRSMARRGQTEWHVMSPVARSKDDSRTFVMLRKNKKSHTALVSALVARAFVPNPDGHKIVGFKDGDVTNNKSDNLVWVSHSEKFNKTRALNGTARTPVECSADDCDRQAKTRGMCQKHYYRNYRKTSFGTGAGVVKRSIVSYVGAHERVRKHKGFPSNFPCAECGGKATEWALSATADDLYAASNGRYKGALYSMNVEDYLPMCRGCHCAYDVKHRETFANKEFTTVSVFQAAPSPKALEVTELLKELGSLKAVSEKTGLSMSGISRIFLQVTGQRWVSYRKEAAA